MSQKEQKYGFFATKGTPFHQVLEYLKKSSSKSFRAVIEDNLLLSEYPHLLFERGAPPKQVVRQAEESIRRFNEKITALTALITSMPEVSETQSDATTEEASSTTPLEATDETDDEYQHLCASEYF